VVAGYEVGIRIGMALGIPHFLRGFHPQGTIGVFCAAASAARMLGLDAAGTSAALAIAASQGAGLMGAQEGGMVKRFHSGRACQSGVMSAQLAARGFTGAHNALEARFGGFLETMRGDTTDYPALTAGLGTVWETEQVGFKAYASCATVHTSIDVMREIVGRNGLAAADVEEVVVHVTTDAFIHSGFEYRAEDVVSAQMNIPFGVAAFLADGEVGPRQFAEERLADPRILELVRKVRVEPDADLDAKGRSKRFSAWAELRTRDGRSLRAATETRRGEGDLQLTDAELFAKFDGLAAAVPGVDGKALLEQTMALEQLPNVAALGALLCPPGGSA
jgi:2-methylcitrate dehydratase PrpD